MKKILFFIAIIFISVPTLYISASSLNLPKTITESTIFSDIYNDGTNVQFIIASRVKLPQNDWYPYLNDQSGCTDQSVANCTFPDTLSSTLVSIGLYKGGDPNQVANQYGSNWVRRYRTIGDQYYGLNIDVLPDGKTPSEIASDGSEICLIIYNAEYYWNGAQIVYVGAGSPDYLCDDIREAESVDEETDQKAELINYIANGFFSIEQDNSLTQGTLITNNEKVTNQGVPMANRISDLLQQQLPELFAVGLLDVFGTPVPSQTTTLETYFQNQSQSSTIASAFAGVGKQYFGMSGNLLAGLTIGSLALISGAGIFLLSGNSTAGLTFGFTTAFVVGFWFIPSWVVIFGGVIFVLSVFAVAWLTKKLPT